MIGNIHLQLELVMMEKRTKLLAIYGAIPSRVWAEMALQLLCDPPNLSNKVWGFLLDFIYCHLVWLRVMQQRFEASYSNA